MTDCAWMTAPASSPALRAPARGLRDLTPAPSSKRLAGVPLTLISAAMDIGKILAGTVILGLTGETSYESWMAHIRTP